MYYSFYGSYDCEDVRFRSILDLNVGAEDGRERATVLQLRYYHKCCDEQSAQFSLVISFSQFKVSIITHTDWLAVFTLIRDNIHTVEDGYSSFMTRTAQRLPVDLFATVASTG